MNAQSKKRYKDIDFPYICPISNREFNSSKGLSVYVSRTLKINHEDYYNDYIHHRDINCFFCKNVGTFISIGKGYRNLCEREECIKKSFNSHSIEGFMYRNLCSIEEAEVLFNSENERQLDKRLKTQNELRTEDPMWDKKRSRNCKEFWINKGLSIDDANIKVKEVMSEIHQKTSKILKENPEKYTYKYPTKIEYYTSRGISEEEAIKTIAGIQNRFSLEKCIEKYGKEEGILIFQQRQEKWQKTLKDNGNIKGGYSKISQILFIDIISDYNRKELPNVFFWIKNYEFSIRSEKSIFLYDFTDIKRKKIIEYNGDQYHANPKIYDKDSYPHPYNKREGFSAENIWEKDKRKKDLANINGFDVLVVWDSEYRKDPQQILEKCIEFINN